MKSRKLWIGMVALALSWTGAARAMEDQALMEQARCSSTEMLGAAMAGYKLMRTAKVVVKTRRSDLVLLHGAMEPGSTVKVMGLQPTRLFTLERAGVESALVGASFSASYPVETSQLVDAYQGGLRRKLKMRAVDPGHLKALGIETLLISEAVEASEVVLGAAIATNKDRFMFCAKKKQLAEFLR